MHLSPLDWVMDLGKTTEVDKFSPCRVKDTYFRNALLLSVLSFLSRPREFCQTWLSIDTIRMEYCSLLSPHACMCIWMYWSVCPFVRSVQQWLIYISMDSWVCFYTLGYNLAPFIFLLRFFPFGHGSPFSLLLTLFTYPYPFFWGYIFLHLGTVLSSSCILLFSDSSFAPALEKCSTSFCPTQLQMRDVLSFRLGSSVSDAVFLSESLQDFVFVLFHEDSLWCGLTCASL